VVAVAVGAIAVVAVGAIAVVAVVAMAVVVVVAMVVVVEPQIAPSILKTHKAREFSAGA
jgi:hypothetical protein